MNEAIKPFLCDTIEPSLLRLEWQKWFRSFTLYLNSEDITDNVKKKNKLLHLAGPQLQEVIYSFPGALVEQNIDKSNDVYQIVVDKLHSHFSPVRNSTFERHLFRNMKVMPGENLNKFIIRLRLQLEKCSFGNTAKECAQISLKDKLIDEWAPVELKKLLLEKELSLDEVIDKCFVHEEVSVQSKVMTTVVSEVNKIFNMSSRNVGECGRCGQRSHRTDDVNCLAKSAKCNKCNFIGHFSKKCKTKSQKRRLPDSVTSFSKRRRYDNSSKVRCIEDNSCSTDERQETETMKTFDCFKIQDNFRNNFDEIVKCSIGGADISMLIDSGSRFNLLSEKEYERLYRNKATIWNYRTQSKVQFKAYAGNELLSILGVFEAPIRVDNNTQ